MIVKYVTGPTGNFTGTGWRAMARIATPGQDTSIYIRNKNESNLIDKINCFYRF